MRARGIPQTFGMSVGQRLRRALPLCRGAWYWICALDFHERLERSFAHRTSALSSAVIGPSSSRLVSLSGRWREQHSALLCSVPRILLDPRESARAHGSRAVSRLLDGRDLGLLLESALDVRQLREARTGGDSLLRLARDHGGRELGAARISLRTGPDFDPSHLDRRDRTYDCSELSRRKIHRLPRRLASGSTMSRKRWSSRYDDEFSPEL